MLNRDLFWAGTLLLLLFFLLPWGPKEYKYESALVNCEQSNKSASEERKVESGKELGTQSFIETAGAFREMKIRHGVARGAGPICIKEIHSFAPANIQAIFS